MVDIQRGKKACRIFKIPYTVNYKESADNIVVLIKILKQKLAENAQRKRD